MGSPEPGILVFDGSPQPGPSGGGGTIPALYKPLLRRNECVIIACIFFAHGSSVPILHR